MSLHPLFEIASVVSLAALLLRDQAALRLTFLLVHALYIANNVVGGEAVDAESVVWNVLNIAVDVCFLADMLYARTTLLFSAEDRELFGRLGGLAPGEFRRFMKSSVRRRADVETAITVEGVTPDKLFFV